MSDLQSNHDVDCIIYGQKQETRRVPKASALRLDYHLDASFGVVFHRARRSWHRTKHIQLDNFCKTDYWDNIYIVKLWIIIQSMYMII